MDLMKEIVIELIERAGVSKDKIWGIGVGLPGPKNVSEGSALKNVVNPKFLPGRDNVPVVKIL